MNQGNLGGYVLYIQQIGVGGFPSATNISKTDCFPSAELQHIE